MPLDRGKLDRLISSGRTLSQVLPESKGRVLADFIVNDFVPSEDLPDIRLNGLPAKMPPEMYYERERDSIYGKYSGHVATSELKRTDDDFVDYLRVAYDFDLCFFEVAVVIFAKPETLTGEYVVLTGTKISQKLGPLERVEASFHVTGLNMTGEKGQILAAIHASELLDQLRAG